MEAWANGQPWWRADQSNYWTEAAIAAAAAAAASLLLLHVVRLRRLGAVGGVWMGA